MDCDISVDVRELEQFERQLARLTNAARDAFMEACVKELAARLLAKVVKRTPVGDYHKEVTYTPKKGKYAGQTRTKRINPSGKQGGTLRRGWTSLTQTEAEEKSSKKSVQEHLGRVRVIRSGGLVAVQVVNPVEYAPYVEYGHRAPHGNGKSTPGVHMLTLSVEELQGSARAIVDRKLTQLIEEVFPDG